MKVSNASFGHMISWRLTSADLDGTSAMSQNVFASVGRRGPQVHHRPLEIVGCERKKKCYSSYNQSMDEWRHAKEGRARALATFHVQG